MSRTKKENDYGTGIPKHEVDALIRILITEIEKFYESEEGQKEFQEWEAQQAKKNTRVA